MRGSRNATALLTKGFGNFLDLLYPRRCPLCHEILKNRHRLLCPECEKKLRPVTGARCYKCSKPVKAHEEYCADCQRQKRAFEEGKGIFLYNRKMKDSLMKYKYYGCREYGRFYACAMHRYAAEELRRWNPDVIIPVPLYWKKERIRGFNQSGYLADRLSEYTGIPTDHDAVKKIKQTKSQKKLNAVQRRKNLKNAFAVTKRMDGRRILLVDDVYTTGSTVDALAECLLEAGAKGVWFLTLCIGRNS